MTYDERLHYFDARAVMETEVVMMKMTFRFLMVLTN